MPATAKNTIRFDKGRLALLRPYLPDLQQVCRKYGVEKLYVFGSLATDKFNERNSDIDFLVSFKSNDRIAMNLLSMLLDLEALLSRKVDLIRERPFENEYFAKAMADTKTLVYAAGNQEILA